MISWQELSKYNNDNPPTSNLGRTNDVENQYTIFKTSFVKKKISISDYIYTKYFSGTNKRYIIVPNHFPYKLEQNITHNLLWINPKITFNKSEIIGIINRNFDTNNIIYFENITEYKSVKEIRHIHIFVKN